MISLMSSKGWVNGLVFPSMGILIVPFTLKQKKLAKPNIFEVPTPLSKLVIKVLMVSKWGRRTYLDSVCLLTAAPLLLGHHLFSPSLHFTTLFQLLIPATKEQLCRTESDVYAL